MNQEVPCYSKHWWMTSMMTGSLLFTFFPCLRKYICIFGGVVGEMISWSKHVMRPKYQMRKLTNIPVWGEERKGGMEEGRKGRRNGGREEVWSSSSSAFL